jgi:hypothetical protein
LPEQWLVRLLDKKWLRPKLRSIFWALSLPLFSERWVFVKKKKKKKKTKTWPPPQRAQRVVLLCGRRHVNSDRGISFLEDRREGLVGYS